MAFIRRILPFHTSAWNAASEPNQRMLDTMETNKLEGERLTKLWREETQTHLQSISITV